MNALGISNLDRRQVEAEYGSRKGGGEVSRHKWTLRWEAKERVLGLR